MSTKGSIYRHEKTGNTYELVTTCILEKDAETVMVVYSDYPHNKTTWVRPEKEFFDGRFTYLGPTPEYPFDPIKDLEEFHRKFGLKGNVTPGALCVETAALRRKLLTEEVDEWWEAQTLAFYHTTRSPSHLERSAYESDLAEALDGLVDLAYVLFGTIHLHGFNRIFGEAWYRVHQANMGKVRANSDGTNSKRRSPLDIVKPEGWEPPYIKDLVRGFPINRT